VNVAEVGSAACKSRTALSAHEDSSEMGYHRCHGEGRANDCSLTLKRVLEASVWMFIPDSGNVVRTRLVLYEPTACIRYGCAASVTRIGMQSARPGVKLATYNIEGLFFEHGNPDSSAGSAIPGELPSPVMSRAGGGGSVVVGARESRAHGKGSQ
jgi:hypothetical protein